MTTHLERVLDLLRSDDFNAASVECATWRGSEPRSVEALNLSGIVEMRRNNFAGAADFFVASLNFDPNSSKAHCNLGLAYRQLGRGAEALQELRSAATLASTVPDIQLNLITLLLEHEHWEEAQVAIESASSLFPETERLGVLHIRCLIGLGHLEMARRGIECLTRDYLERTGLWHGLGDAAMKLGESKLALDAYRQACILSPANPIVLHSLGRALLREGNARDAIVWLERAYELQAGNMDVVIDLSTALVLNHRFLEARRILEAAIREWPDNEWLLYNLGNVESANHDFIRAETRFLKAISHDERFTLAWHALGCVREQLGNEEKAIECYQHALSIDPACAEAHCNLGGIFWRRLRVPEAENHWRKAIALNGNLAAAHCNLGMALLATGRLDEGWIEYAWRERATTPAHGSSHVFVARNEWRGEDIRGKRLLIRNEQGLGDTLQFVRYASLIQERGCRVFVACQSPLKRLLERVNGIEVLIEAGAPVPDFDVHVFMLNVPRVCGTNLSNIPCEIPYLSAYPDEVAYWRKCVSVAANGLRVGVVWAGSAQNPNDGNRSMAFELLAPIFAVKGVSWFSLQKGLAFIPSERLGADSDFFDWTAQLNDFADTAALIENLDLVITVDTAVAHLSGAMGKPTWVMLPYVPDWRWLLDRDDSAWYKTLRLFRQTKPGEWRDVVESVAQALTLLVTG